MLVVGILLVVCSVIGGIFFVKNVLMSETNHVEQVELVTDVELSTMSAE